MKNVQRYSRAAQLGLFAFAFLSVSAVSAPASKAIVIAQENAPVQILTYAAVYAARDTYSTAGIHHTVTMLNRGSQKIVAMRVGIVSFDVFNGFIGKFGGVAMEDLLPGKTAKGSWNQASYGDFSFLTGLAYIETVRLDDGTIWKADDETILAEIRKIEKDFDAKLLRDKQPGL